MIVRLPELTLEVPNRATLWSVARKGLIAAAVIASLACLAHWRSQAGMDRKGLEKLAADSGADPVATGSVGRKTPRR